MVNLNNIHTLVFLIYGFRLDKKQYFPALPRVFLSFILHFKHTERFQ